MHANPIPLQNLSALCNILITAVQRLNHWLCHFSICFLQVSVVHGWNGFAFAPRSVFLLVNVDIRFALQFQGAFCCTVLACGWVWAGCMRLKEVRRLQAQNLRNTTKNLSARHGGSATTAFANCLSRQAACAHDVKVSYCGSALLCSDPLCSPPLCSSPLCSPPLSSALLCFTHTMMTAVLQEGMT